MPPAKLATNAERAAISLASRIEPVWCRRGEAVAPFTRAGPDRREGMPKAAAMNTSGSKYQNAIYGQFSVKDQLHALTGLGVARENSKQSGRTKCVVLALFQNEKNHDVWTALVMSIQTSAIRNLLHSSRRRQVDYQVSKCCLLFRYSQLSVA